MAMRKTTTSAGRKTSKPETPREPDQKLIETCVAITSGLAAFHGAFRGDPDSNSAHAESFLGRTEGETAVLKAQAADMPAQTLQGLRAKARAALAMLQDDEDTPDPESVALYVSFAKDVERVLEAVVESEKKAALAAEAKGA